MTNKRYGRLLVVSRAGSSEQGHALWLCICDCGASHTVRGDVLRGGLTTSCGCWKIEGAAEYPKRHGHTGTGWASPTYNSWRRMHQRCGDKKHRSWPRYGGRGIKVCERWASFDAFLDDMGERPSPAHSVERKDTDGDYEPLNCVWATSPAQNRNKSTNRYVTVDGKQMVILDAAKAVGLPASVLYKRIEAGWDEKTALQTPTRRYNRKK